MEQDWNPEAYARFRGLRLRPARDLLAQVIELPAGAAIDLGCGDGAAGPLLAARFAPVIGVDSSPAMLGKARATGDYTALEQADIADWSPAAPPALIFSNAALHWLGSHARLFPRLAQSLRPGGVLAVQMPAQFDAPSHALLRATARALWPDREGGWPQTSPVHLAAAYHEWLSPLGQVEVWETTYFQHQPAVASGHPVRAFTESTAMRPFLAGRTPAEVSAFVAAYDQALQSAYPLLPDGSALFPFRRLFLTVKV